MSTFFWIVIKQGMAGSGIIWKRKDLMRSWTAAGPAGLSPLREGLTAIMQSPKYRALPLADKRLRVEA